MGRVETERLGVPPSEMKSGREVLFSGGAASPLML